MNDFLIGLIVCLILLGTLTFYYFKGRRDLLGEMLEKGDISVETYKKHI